MAVASLGYLFPSWEMELVGVTRGVAAEKNPHWDVQYWNTDVMGVQSYLEKQEWKVLRGMGGKTVSEGVLKPAMAWAVFADDKEWAHLWANPLPKAHREGLNKHNIFATVLFGVKMNFPPASGEMNLWEIVQEERGARLLENKSQARCRHLRKSILEKLRKEANLKGLARAVGKEV